MEHPHPEPEFEARFETAREFIETIKHQLQTDDNYARHIYNAITMEDSNLAGAVNSYLETLDSAVIARQFLYHPDRVFAAGQRLNSRESHEIVYRKVLHYIYRGRASEMVADEPLAKVTQLFIDFGERTVQKTTHSLSGRTGEDQKVA